MEVIREARRRYFEREVTRLMDRLYGTALRLTRNPDDAEDVVAETVSKAWAKLDDLRELNCFERWLFHILNNTFISAWRRRHSREKMEASMDTSTLESDDSDDNFSLFQKLHQPFLLWWGTAEDAFLNDLLRDDLQRAIDALPDAYRIVIVLVEVQGYTYQKVSDLLGIPLGTVRSRLNRGRASLQKAFWVRAGEAGLTDGSPNPGFRPGGRG